MSHGVRVTYYLRPYLADYLHHHYGTHSTPLPPSVRSEESPLVLYLNCTLSRTRAQRDQLDAYAQGRAAYHLYISPRRARSLGRYANLHGQRNFERLVYQQFMGQLITHIAAHKRHGVQLIASIIDFMLLNNIDPQHIDADHLRRVVYKVTNRGQRLKKSATTVPANSALTTAPSQS